MNAGGAAPSPRVRLSADARRVLLIDAAAQVFTERGYAQSGLAEIAGVAGVSKTLLYHYFPDGRPELYRAVMDRLVADLLTRVRTAVRAPVAPAQRVDSVVDAFLGFFDAEPAAFRLLILEPWGSGDSSVVGQAMGVRVRLGSELSTLLAGAGRPLAHTQGAAAATIGVLLQVAELWMAGQLNRADAVEVAGDFVRGGLERLGFLA